MSVATASHSVVPGSIVRLQGIVDGPDMFVLDAIAAPPNVCGSIAIPICASPLSALGFEVRERRWEGFRRARGDELPLIDVAPAVQVT